VVEYLRVFHHVGFFSLEAAYQEGFSVYEIVVRFRQREDVIETVASLELAMFFLD
jgi:hypothetical protein